MAGSPSVDGDEAGRRTPEEGEQLRRRSGPMLAEVTKAMVRLHSDHYGRGATKARTEWVGGDMLICVLRDCFTRLERTLIEQGDHRTVRETRQAFHDVMHDRFTKTVEAIVGREVVGLLGQISAEPECAVQIFIFAHDADGGPWTGAHAEERAMEWTEEAGAERA
jgi:uncharacterized protein YbcI